MGNGFASSWRPSGRGGRGPPVIRVKVAATLAGLTSAATLTWLRAQVGESIPDAVGHSLIASVFAAGGAWFVLKDRVARQTRDFDEHEKRDDDRFEKLGDKLDEIHGEVQFISGQMKARSEGQLHTRAGE